MNKIIQARLDMNYAVLLTFQVYANTISKLPALASLVEELKANVEALANGMMVLTGNDEGVTDDKTNTRLELAAQCAINSGTLTSYATDKGLLELKKKVKERPSVLKVMGAGKLLNFARLVLQEMKTHLAGLSAYNITAAEVNDFDVQITRMTEAIAAPKKAGSMKQAVSEEMDELVKKNRVLHKERIAPLVLKFRKTDPAFYTEYTATSKIRTPYTSHTRAQGLVTDSSTGLAVKDVEVKATGTDYITKTGRDGSFRLLIPEKGIYTLVFEKAGYGVYEQKEVELTIGAATVVKVVLKPIG